MVNKVKIENAKMKTINLESGMIMEKRKMLRDIIFTTTANRLNKGSKIAVTAKQRKYKKKLSQYFPWYYFLRKNKIRYYFY